MAKPKGSKKIGGRKKGTPNVLTKTVKEVLNDTFVKLQSDNDVNLESWGKQNPTDFYKLCAKLIPAAIDMTSKGESIAPLPPPTAKEIKDISNKLENEC